MAQQCPPHTQPAYSTQVGVGYPTQPGYHPVPAQFPSGTIAEAPPPYFHGTAPQAPTCMQQSSTNVVVVSQQPMPTVVAVHPVGDHYMTMSVVLTILCVLSGAWWALCCTIPAIVFSSMAQDDDRRGDYASAQSHGKVALGLNIAGLVSSIAIIILIAVILPVALITADTSCYSASYTYYYYYYC